MKSFGKCARSHFAAVADARLESCIGSDTEEHRRDDRNLQQTHGGEHDGVN
jgi:hypothetical protein